MRERLTASAEAARTVPLAGTGRKWGRGPDGRRGDVLGDSMGVKGQGDIVTAARCSGV